MNGITGWSVGGTTNLRTLGYNVHDSSSWDSAPSTRGGGIDIAYLDGSTFQTGAYATHIFNLEFLIWGRDPATGGITLGDEWEHLAANVDTVKGLFDGDDDIDLRRTMPDATIRQALCRLAGPIRSRSDAQGALRYLTVPLAVREATWRDITGGTAGESNTANVNLTGTGTTGNIVVGGNVRTSPVLTFTADNTVTDVSFTFPDGATLAWEGTVATGTALVLDCANRVVTNDGVYADAGLVSTGRRAYWGRLEAATSNTLGYTIGSGQGDLTVQWWDRWR